MCRVQYGDTIHVFVDRTKYKGLFMPGFRAITAADPLLAALCVPLLVCGYLSCCVLFAVCCLLFASLLVLVCADMLVSLC